MMIYETLKNVARGIVLPSALGTVFDRIAARSSERKIARYKYEKK